MDFVTLTAEEAKAVKDFACCDLFEWEPLYSALQKMGATPEELFWL